MESFPGGDAREPGRAHVRERREVQVGRGTGLGEQLAALSEAWVRAFPNVIHGASDQLERLEIVEEPLLDRLLEAKAHRDDGQRRP